MTTDWLSLPDSDAPLLLILPFAGAGRSFFTSWPAVFAPRVAVGFVNLPGRDRRLLEPAVDDLPTLVKALTEAATPVLAGRRYTVLGHSMGALVGYEWAHAMREAGAAPPRRLIASGFCAPDTRQPGPALADADDERLLAELGLLDGQPPVAEPMRAYLREMLPTARADLRLCESYRYTERPPLDVPITALWGRQDPYTTLDGVLAWGRHTTRDFRTHSYPGAHFFLRDQAAAVAARIAGSCRA